jgi:hypothetical protein
LIRIRRPSPAPAILTGKGKAKRRAHSASFTRSPDQYRAGTKTFDFDSGIYGHAQVKQRLLEMQHGKCAFCESKIAHIAYGDVEHFRPKAAVQQLASDPLNRPGYYWLAYEWSNLLLSCQICNQRHKGNLFPLVNPEARARSHRDSLAVERPQFVSPADEEPAVLISFRAEVAFGIDPDGRGDATKESLGLNRPALLERRRDRFEQLKALFGIVELARAEPGSAQLAGLAKDALRILEQGVSDAAEYAGMVRAALANRFEIPGS